jgi:hypothetical protein
MTGFNYTTRQDVLDTVTVHTLIDVEGSIKSFKRSCRPAGRGRPTRRGTRLINFDGLTIEVKIGESCLGAGGFGMTTTLLLNGKRTTIQKIAKAHLACR